MVQLNPFIGDRFGQIPLAIAWCDVFCVLMKRKKGDVKVRDNECRTPLIMACSTENVGRSHLYLRIVCELLKRKEGHVNISHYTGLAPLIAACSTGLRGRSENDVLIVRELLKHNEVDVNIRDYNGCNPLIAACFKRFEARSEIDSAIVCELLKHKEANVNIRDDDGRTSLIATCSYGFGPRSEIDFHIVFVIEKLADHRCESQRQKNVARPFTWPAQRIDGNCSRVVESHRCGCERPRCSRQHSDTALICACLRGRLDVACELLDDDRVDLSVRNKAGSTALDICSQI